MQQGYWEKSYARFSYKAVISSVVQPPRAFDIRIGSSKAKGMSDRIAYPVTASASKGCATAQEQAVSVESTAIPELSLDTRSRDDTCCGIFACLFRSSN